MTDLQVFDMNSQLNFPISEKSIYQMPFNSGAPPTVTNYVTEPNPLTNHLQILEMLNNPQNPGVEDKKRQFFADLMAPHYEKQTEIEKKIEFLTETLNAFIQTQKAVNEMFLEKRSRANSTQNVQEPRMKEQTEEDVGQSDLNGQQHTINNPRPVYPVPIPHETSHSPIRNRSISPEKMETEMSVRDFLKNTMTVQKADEKILEEERARDRDEAATTVKYNKFRVRNRPKKYKRSAVTFTSSVETSSAILENSGGVGGHLETNSGANVDLTPPSSSKQSNQCAEHEENVFQPIVVPCVQRAEIDLALMQPMQPVFPATSSYVSLNRTAQNSLSTALSAATEQPKFSTDPNNIWKAVDGVTQLLVDAPTLLDYDVRTIADHSHHSSFLPFVTTNQEHMHPRSAFVPPYQKDRRIQMDPNITDSLRNL